MKKGIRFGLGLLCLGLMFTGCSDKKEEQEKEQQEEQQEEQQSAGADRIRGSVKEINYVGVEYEPYDTSISDKEIEARLENFTKTHKITEEVTDRTTVQEGDVVNIDYAGFMDGEQFQGGTDTGFDLTIGSGQFIPGFEDGLIGAEKGTTVDVNIAFPDPYKNNPDFSGKPVLFQVTINKISVARESELTDELVAANTSYATVEEYRNYITENLSKTKEEYADNHKKTSVMDALIDGAEFEGIQEEDVNRLYESTSAYYSNMASMYQTYYGYSYSDFLYYFFGCSSEEEFTNMLKENAEREVKKNLILYYVVDAEKFTVSDEEYNEAVTRYASLYSLSEEEFLAQVSEAQIRETVQLEKAEQFIYDSAVAVK